VTRRPSHLLLERRPGEAARPGAGEVRLFTKCRNERARLPAFLRHYRDLGVSGFYVVDNASTDGTTDYLLRQPDVRVFLTTDSFREARGGTDWLNALLAVFGVGGWCLTVDVDELLVYPGSETAPLSALTAHLDQRGVQALSCLLLDMYPADSLSDAAFRDGADLVAAAPFFDPGPYRRFPFALCPGHFTVGGVRERVFYPEFRERRIGHRVHSALYNRVAKRIPGVRDLAWIRASKPAVPPCLTKVPLVRWDERSEYLDCNHFVSRKPVAAETGALLHFKFLQDFHAKAVAEAARGEYFEGASEYRRYARRLGAHPALTLMYDGSTRFRDSAQLVGLKLIDDTLEWADARVSRAPVRRFAGGAA